MRKTRQKRPTEPEYIAERLSELAAKGFLRVVGYRHSERNRRAAARLHHHDRRLRALRHRSSPVAEELTEATMIYCLVSYVRRQDASRG